MKEILRYLEDEFFDRLEENCVDFLYYNQIGDNQFEPVIKEEFILSPDDMAKYLGFVNFDAYAYDYLMEELC